MRMVTRTPGRSARTPNRAPYVLDGRKQGNYSRFKAMQGEFVPDNEYMEYMEQKRAHLQQIERKRLEQVERKHERGLTSQEAWNLSEPMPHLEQKSVVVPVDWKSGAIEKKGAFYTLTGYASYFGNVDMHNDIMHPGAFGDLSRVHDGMVKLCLGHSYELNDILGVVTKAKPDEKGLFIEARLDTGNSHFKTVKKQVARGVLNGLSVGFQARESHYNSEGNRVITKADLLEVSLVPFPSNSKAKILSFKGDIVERAKQFNKLYKQTQ